MLAPLWRWLTRELAYQRAQFRLEPDLKHLDDGTLRLDYGDDPWDVWGDE